jgi:hypothetical protein
MSNTKERHAVAFKLHSAQFDRLTSSAAHRQMGCDELARQIIIGIITRGHVDSVLEKYRSWILDNITAAGGGEAKARRRKRKKIESDLKNRIGA